MIYVFGKTATFRLADCEILLYTFSRSVISAVIGWPKRSLIGYLKCSLIGWPSRSVIGSISMFSYGVQPNVRNFEPTIPVDVIGYGNPCQYIWRVFSLGRSRSCWHVRKLQTFEYRPSGRSVRVLLFFLAPFFPFHQCIDAVTFTTGDHMHVTSACSRTSIVKQSKKHILLFNSRVE